MQHSALTGYVTTALVNSAQLQPSVTQPASPPHDCAIIRSSSARHDETPPILDSDALILRTPCPFASLTRRIDQRIPNPPSLRAISARDRASCSPIPPVNTTASTPPISATNPPIAFVTLRVNTSSASLPLMPSIAHAAAYLPHRLHIVRLPTQRPIRIPDPWFSIALTDPLSSLPLPQQIKHQPRIEIARPRPHHHAARRRQPHRRIHRPPIHHAVTLHPLPRCAITMRFGSSTLRPHPAAQSTRSSAHETHTAAHPAPDTSCGIGYIVASSGIVS